MNNTSLNYQYNMNTTILPTVSTASAVQIIYQSVLIIYMVLGIIGNVFNIFIFTRPAIARTSASLYLLSTSVANLFVTGFSIPFRLFVDGFNLDITSLSILVCKLVSYIYYVSLALPPFFTVLACADRWAASCVQVNRRRFANVRIAKQIIPITIIICCLLYSYILVTFTSDPDPPPPLCSVAENYATFAVSFQLIIYSLVPPFFMALFSISIILNIRQRRHRVIPVARVINTSNVGGIAINRGLPNSRLTQMQVMLVCQAIIECMFTLPFSVINLISIMVVNDDYFLLIYSFVRLIIFFNYISSFYIYTLSSKLYRKELYKIGELLCKRE